MTPTRRACLEAEMASGRLIAMRQSPAPTAEEIEELTMAVEAARHKLRVTVEAATGCDVGTLRQALSI